MTVRIAALGRELSRHHEVRHLTLAAPPPWRRRGMTKYAADSSHSELRRVHPLGALVMRASAGSWHGAPVLAGLGMRAAGPAAIVDQFRWADVVLVHFPWQFRLSRGLAPSGTPCVYSAHNVETDKFRSWAEALNVPPARAAPWLRYIRRAERYAVANADLVTTVSELDRAEFIERFRADPARTVVVPNGVDTRHFRPATAEQRAAARRELGLPDRPIVLFHGSNMPANTAGLEWVHRLAASDGQFTYLVAGSVAAPERAERLIIRGPVADMQPYLAAADFGLCPIAHGGGTKLKLLECLASGLPTVTFAGGIRGTTARDGEHVLVVPPDEVRILDALGSLAADRRAAERLGSAGRELAERSYDWGTIAARLERALVGFTQGGRAERSTPPPTAARAGALGLRRDAGSAAETGSGSASSRRASPPSARGRA
jgi:glycosyltransferase involved in cell wall biosynthesis